MSARPARKRRRTRTTLGIVILLATVLFGWGALSLNRAAFDGKAALQSVERMVSFGPRPPGSEAHRRTQSYITQELEAAGLTVVQDPFTANTPAGPVSMNNIIGRIAGRKERVLMLAAHYDTKVMNDFRFLGANDGGSGTGLLLSLAPVLANLDNDHSIWLVFLDGEEAFEEWSDTDSLYGSRHLVARLAQSGLLSKIGAFVLVDMIGDSSLDIRRDTNSTPWLTDMVWDVARRLGYSRNFSNSSMTILDDHLPFVQAGVPSVVLIDLNYGWGNRFWHTPQDTLDKLSAESFSKVGHVLLEVVAELDRE
ncbi:MAG: M28 family peptidase [Acidobacteria bacterium]|nr:M28 family peptidase [Acidobacteriota bacterium]